MSFGIKLKRTLKSQNKTNKDLSEYMGISRGLVTHWCNDFRNPNPKQLEQIVKFLKIDATELIGDNIDKIPVKYVPVVANVSCGSVDLNLLQDTTMSVAISANSWNSNLYGVIANGDSMANEIYDGDVCVVDPLANIQNGDIVLYKINEEAAIKIYVKDEDNYLINFIPFNSNENFKTRTIRLDDEDSLNKLTIHKVVQVVSFKTHNRKARLKMIGR